MSGSRFAGRTALVTGADGFIGAWVAELLLAEGACVVATRRDAPAISRFRTAGIAERCDVVQADLLDYEGLVRVLNEHGVNVVFHLAAQTIVGTANRSPLSSFESNVRGTYNLLEACRTTGAVGDPVEGIVVASSDKAYGAQDRLPYREDAPLEASFPYDVSKACSDMIARSYARTYQLPVAVTRLANVYGPGDLNFSRLVPDTARALVKDERPVLRSDGTPERDFIYVEDAARAYLSVALSLECEELRGRAWNAGVGRPVTVLEIVERLISISGRDLEPDVAGPGTPFAEIDRQYLDSGAIEREIGWTPEWSLERGLPETYAWYEAALR